MSAAVSYEPWRRTSIAATGRRAPESRPWSRWKPRVAELSRKITFGWTWRGPERRIAGRLHSGVLRGSGDDLYIELRTANANQSVWAASGMESPLSSDVSSA